MCLTLQDGHLGLRHHGIYHESQLRQALSGLKVPKYLFNEEPVFTDIAPVEGKVGAYLDGIGGKIGGL